MLVFRSLLFNLVFYINLVLFLVLGFWFMFTPRSWSMAALKTWASVSLWWMKLITGTTMEVRGREPSTRHLHFRDHGGRRGDET